jgi:hypothetical protein
MASKSKLSRLLGEGSEPSSRHAFETDGERGLDAPLDHAGLAVEQLQLDQPGEVADVIDVLDGALPGQLVMLAQHGRQLELAQVMAQQDLRRLGRGAHDAGVPSRAM